MPSASSLSLNASRRPFFLCLPLLLLLVEAKEEPKIDGRAASLVQANCSVAWEVAADFYGLAKWVPSIQECGEIRAGVRYCKSIASSNGSFSWVEEQLTSLDECRRELSYKVVAGNFGLVNYDATMDFKAVRGDQCLFTWSFSMSPLSTRSKQVQEAYLLYGIGNLDKRAQMIAKGTAAS